MGNIGAEEPAHRSLDFDTLSSRSGFAGFDDTLLNQRSLTPLKNDDGSVSCVLSDADAGTIDVCEQALLQTTYPLLRETRATHLCEVSKKKPKTMNRRAR